MCTHLHCTPYVHSLRIGYRLPCSMVRTRNRFFTLQRDSNELLGAGHARLSPHTSIHSPRGTKMSISWSAMWTRCLMWLSGIVFDLCECWLCHKFKYWARMNRTYSLYGGQRLSSWRASRKLIKSREPINRKQLTLYLSCTITLALRIFQRTRGSCKEARISNSLQRPRPNIRRALLIYQLFLS